MEVVAGTDHTCIRNVSGEVFCWGSNLEGQLGLGDNTARTRPTSPVSLPAAAVAIAAGDAHTCAALADGSVHCWGDNNDGQLGVAGGGTRLAPVPVEWP